MPLQQTTAKNAPRLSASVAMHVGQNRMPNVATDDRKLLFFLDGLRYSFEIAFHNHDILWEALNQIERASPEAPEDKLVVRAVASAWGLIDVAHRIRELLQTVPGLKQNLPKLRLFTRSTKEVETLRHYVQHLRTGIADLPTPSTPLWGVISWVSRTDELLSYSLFSGTPHSSVHMPSLIFDRFARRFTQQLALAVNDVTVDLDALIERLRDVHGFLREWAGCVGYSFQPPVNLLSAIKFQRDQPQAGK